MARKLLDRYHSFHGLCTLFRSIPISCSAGTREDNSQLPNSPKDNYASSTHDKRVMKKITQADYITSLLKESNGEYAKKTCKSYAFKVQFWVRKHCMLTSSFLLRKLTGYLAIIGLLGLTVCYLDRSAP